MIKGFEPRLYQQTILATAVKHDTLVVLPTGLGKTMVAVMLAAHRLEHYSGSKVLVLAPTRPLCEQHAASFRNHLDIPEERIVLFTGHVKPETREELWKDARVVISTPQGLENDILTKRIKLDSVSLLVVDEAHRAVGDYGYVFIAKRYFASASHARLLALTASPGSRKEDIQEVMQNLHIEDIEVRTEEDPDVKQYVQEINVDWVTLTPHPKILALRDYLKKAYDDAMTQLAATGHAPNNSSQMNKVDLLHLQRALGASVSRDRDFTAMKALSLIAQATKVQHAIELAETQGVASVVAYLDKLSEQSRSTNVKAVKNLMQHLDVKAAHLLASRLLEEGVEHPKLGEAVRLIRNEYVINKEVKIILFNQYRDQASVLVRALETEKIPCKIFVGQQMKADTGMSQKKQQATLQSFREGGFNVLVATSVAEEGLDIPAVDMVIFYEPVPSAIRTVQRRGRTGRQEKGRVVVLVTKGTRDEAHRWSAHHKEIRMYRELKEMKRTFSPQKSTRSLMDYSDNKLTIYVDHREKASKTVKLLSEQGFTINLSQLEVGDYLLSEDVCVEFKTVRDFVDSIVDGRLLTQAKGLRAYQKPLILIEGDEDMYAQRNMHPSAIQGMLATLALSFQIPVLRTSGPAETAALFGVIAKRFQEDKKKEFTMHSAKPLTLKEQQEYLISSLPGIGPALAKPLLKKFKTPKKLLSASEEKLQKVDLIGEKKAARIREVLDTEYSD
ncbi:MAG: DEAD/DEAH box helicase [Candidatus Woesearchaeota archaeon]